MGEKVNREMVHMPFFTVQFHENDAYVDQIIEAEFVRPSEQVVTFVKRGEVMAEVPRSLVHAINRFMSRMEAELYMVDHSGHSMRRDKTKSPLQQPRRAVQPSAARVQELGVRRPQSLMGKSIAGGLVESVKVTLPGSSDPGDDDQGKKP